MLIDTHTHIYEKEFKDDLDLVIQSAINQDIKKLLIPNVDVNSIDDLHKLCDQYSEICFPMMGLHPTSVDAGYKQQLQIIRSQFEEKKYYGVGEIGIDLYWDKTFIKEQIEAFEQQLQWSIELNLPVAIHTRDAFPEVFDCIENIGAEKLRGVFHSFGGSLDQLEKALSFDHFMLGINGVVTFKNASFGDYLSIAPIDRILLETDAPYLSPAPFRGKRNQPAYLVKIAEKLSEIYGITPQKVAEYTTRNALQLFFS